VVGSIFRTGGSRSIRTIASERGLELDDECPAVGVVQRMQLDLGDVIGSGHRT
jgi:hypothetical protein